jgi:hypothetical protein
MSEVLVVGVYLAARAHSANHILYELLTSRRHTVTLRWAALAIGGEGACDVPCTVMVETKPLLKFILIDRLLADVGSFDWLIITDDDIELPPGFLDSFLALAERYDLALCQPARTVDSYVDHGIVMQMPGLAARRTRFVEIGPLTAIRRDAMPLLLPFGPDAGMGWGLDFVWPVAVEAAGLRMGIVDATPIAHRLRPPVTGYSHEEAARAYCICLASHPHLPPDRALSVLEAYV